MAKLELACRRGHPRTDDNTYERPDGKRECLDCARDRTRERTPEQRDRHRRTARSGALRRRYGITIEEYEQLLASQGGRCAICGNRPRRRQLVVDHDHKSGQVRGLLCSRCNRDGLGAFRDSYDIVENALVYMERARGYFTTPNGGELLEAFK